MESESNEQEWREWLQSHGARLLLFARQQTRRAADAEDVLQDAVVRIWRRVRENDLSNPPPASAVFGEIRRRAIDLGRGADRRGAAGRNPLFRTRSRRRSRELVRIPGRNQGARADDPARAQSDFAGPKRGRHPEDLGRPDLRRDRRQPSTSRPTRRRRATATGSRP